MNNDEKTAETAVDHEINQDSDRSGAKQNIGRAGLTPPEEFIESGDAVLNDAVLDDADLDDVGSVEGASIHVASDEDTEKLPRDIEKGSSSADDEFVDRRPMFQGPPTGLRRGDSQSRLVIDATAGRHCILGFTPEILHDALRDASLDIDGSAFDGESDNFSDADLLASIRNLLGDEPFPGLDRVWTTASCEEAIEQAMMAVRTDERYRIITLDASDHGRTLACRSAGSRFDLRQNIGPITAGFIHIDASTNNPIASLTAAIDDRTAAIMIPPIATANGGRPVSPEIFLAASQLAAQNSLSLIIDHTQTPIGCTGDLLAIEDIACDAVLMSAGLFAGLAGGVVFCRSDFNPRSPVPKRPAQSLVAREVLRRIAQLDIQSHADQSMQSLVVEIAQTMASGDVIEDIRSLGSCVSLSLAVDAMEFSDACIRYGLCVEMIGDDSALMTLPITLSGDDRTLLIETLSQIASTLAAAPA